MKAETPFLLTTPLDELPTTGVAAFIEELAQQHGVSAQRTRLDDWADKVSELSGDDVRLSPGQQLLVNLRRARVISSEQLVRLSLNSQRELAAKAQSLWGRASSASAQPTAGTCGSSTRVRKAPPASTGPPPGCSRSVPRPHPRAHRDARP